MDKNVSGLVKHSLRERHNMSVIIESLETEILEWAKKNGEVAASELSINIKK